MKKFEFISHTADVGVKVYGETIEELFENSGKALFEIMAPVCEDVKVKEKVSVEGESYEELLVKFLNELIYLSEKKSLKGEEFKIKIERKNNSLRLDGEVSGRKIKGVEREVKAATYHNLKIEKDREYNCIIIFDL
ncbi:MAG TPA: archease [bacterium]|nr:archease [bacterium]